MLEACANFTVASILMPLSMPSEMKRLRQLEEENGRLKRIVADLALDKEMLQDVIKRKL